MTIRVDIRKTLRAGQRIGPRAGALHEKSRTPARPAFFAFLAADQAASYAP